MDRITVACVLRSGGVYTPEWVYALRRGVARHLDRPFDFVCLTDRAIAVPWVPLPNDWPGWWAKICLFAPGIFRGPVLYLDLDTLPVGELSEIASYRGPFAMIDDFYRPQVAQSGVMAWTPGPHTEALYQRFASNPRFVGGDGQWLHANSKPHRLQKLYPGQLVSLKAHARNGVPEGARLVCGHGRPRFDDPASGWAHVEWKQRAYGVLEPGEQPALGALMGWL